jgi:lipoprotein-anchoring transpeptidase ErfK/SrfK
VLAAALFALAAAPVAAYAQAAGRYAPLTGHTLTDAHGFLTFWQEHGGERLLGLPITEPLAVEGLGTVQYFERGRLEQVSDPAGQPIVRTGAVAQEYVQALAMTLPPRPPRALVPGELLFEETGHTLREPFLGFWQAAGGAELLGRPISAPLWEQTAAGQRKVQYFERARLERDSSLAGTPDEIRVSDLGRALALLRGLSLDQVPNPGFEALGPSVPLAPDVAVLGSQPTGAAPIPFAAARPAPGAVARPTPAPAPAAPVRPAPTPAPARLAPAAAAAPSGSGKRIVVNLSKQWLYAYEGGELVFDAPVATGRDGMNTPTGTFSIYAKIPVQTMDGVTDGEYWRVPNVPSVMYIYGGVALHGTYWHNLFGSGTRPSHGCVNLPVNSAAWLYRWAPVGTTVKVTY